MASSHTGLCEIRFLKMISAVCGSEFTISVRKQLLPDMLLLLQICCNVLRRSARARCPTLSRSASVTIATAMDQTVESTWLPKGNCSSQAASVCVASHMSDNHNILAVAYNPPVFGETLFSRNTFVSSTCRLFIFCF